jgi:hypothetical protein
MTAMDIIVEIQVAKDAPTVQTPENISQTTNTRSYG